MTERARRVAVVAAGLAIVCIYAYPGYLAYDSLDQLRQARAGVLTDWHPPIMSALWGLLDHIVRGPLLMLLLQCSLFLLGTYALLRRKLSANRAFVLTLVVFAFPPNLTMMAVVLKDGLMTGLLLVGCAGLISERRWPRYAALGAFLVAAALRYNAISIVLPLVALLSPWPAAKGRWVRMAAGAGIAVALTAGGMLVNRALTTAPAHPFHGMLVPMDVVGTLTWAPDLTDDEVRALMPDVAFAPANGLQAYARRIYNVNALALNHTHGPTRLYDDPTTDDGRTAIARAWWNLVSTYPGAYFSARFDSMRELLGFTDNPWTPVYEARNEAHMLAANGEPPLPRNIVQRWLARRMIHLGYSSVIFRPYLYVLLALGLLVLLRRDRLLVALLASGFTCLALDLFVIPAPDIRYCYWLMVVTTLAVVVRLFGSDLRAAAVPRDP